MSVSTDTDAKRRSVAGSSQSTAVHGGTDPGERRLSPQRANDLEDGTPGGWSRQSEARMPSRDRLVWVCDRCDRQLRGSMGELSGFVIVDLRETDAAAKGMLRGPDGPAKARWRTYHARCFPEASRPMNPYFRLWTHRVQSVDELLDAVAELSRLPWFGWSDWGGSLVRKVLADTGKTMDESVALREQRAQRAGQSVAEKRKRAREHKRNQKERGLAPDDPRHGTLNGYTNYGCRCEPCSIAGTKDQRDRRKAKAKS